VFAHQRDGQVRIAGIDVHLPAAGLFQWYISRDAEPFKELCDGPPHLRCPGIDQAGHEQGDAHLTSCQPAMAWCTSWCSLLLIGRAAAGSAWVMKTTARSSTGSAQNTVLAAPPQPNSPAEVG
jgi:hypothetical protein